MLVAVPALSDKQRSSDLLWHLIFIILLLFVGFRYQVRSDWREYLQLIEYIENMTMTELLNMSGIFYFLKLLCSVHFGWVVYGANIVPADNAYTHVQREKYGNVTGIIEAREAGIDGRMAGERDVGLFVFRRDTVMDFLKMDLPGRIAARTGEHCFLYLVEHLATRDKRVSAVQIATPLDLVSLNSHSNRADYA